MNTDKTGVDQERTPHIYDLSFKRLMYLSSLAIIQFINALFETEYPLNSIVDYLSTEYVTDQLKRWISDILIRINHIHDYLIEVQMTEDGEMALRVFNYGYNHSLRTKSVDTKSRTIRLTFPHIVVIYLAPTGNTPDQLTVEILFPDNSIHEFVVPTVKFLNHTIAELEEKKLTILLPFYLLKLRDEVNAVQSGPEMEALAAKVNNLVAELTETIERGQAQGLMNETDLKKVLRTMNMLYAELYQSQAKFKEVNSMVLEMLITDIDEIETRSRLKIAHNFIHGGDNLEKVAKMTELDLDTVEMLSEVENVGDLLDDEQRIMEIAQNLIKKRLL